MTTDTTLAAADELLQARGAGSVLHPGGTLLDHLRRVQHLLADWGAEHEVQLAGLCHACYGTDGFPVALLDTTQRPCLVKVIGTEAEALVYLYGSCDRVRTYPQLGKPVVELKDRFTGLTTIPEQGSLRALVEITAANELDVIRHNQTIATEDGPELDQLFTRADRLLSTPAREAWAKTQTYRPS